MGHFISPVVWEVDFYLSLNLIYRAMAQEPVLIWICFFAVPFPGSRSSTPRGAYFPIPQVLCI